MKAFDYMGLSPIKTQLSKQKTNHSMKQMKIEEKEWSRLVQGFVFKTCYKKPHIKKLFLHPKIPQHYADGALDNKEEGGKWIASGLTPNDLFCIETKLTTRPCQAQDVLYIPKYCIYCIVQEKQVIFCSSKLEVVGSFYSPHIITGLAYNGLLHVSSPHQVTTYSLSASYLSGIVIDAQLKESIQMTEWINFIYTTDFLWLACENQVFIKGQKTPFITMERNITAILYNDLLKYVMMATSDAKLHVVNMTGNIIHTFTLYKPITCLAHYTSSMVLAGTMDPSVAVFNLYSFQKIYTFDVAEPPKCLYFVDDQLWVQSENFISVWSSVNLNRFLTTLTSPISLFKRVENKLLTFTVDGVIRLQCLSSARSITSTFPIIEKVLDICYDDVNQRFYVASPKGIFVYDASTHPATLSAIWDSKELLSEEIQKLCFIKGPDYTFLFGSTRNGHVVTIGKGGKIIDRIQLHSSEIHQMIVQDKYLYTSDAFTIKMCQVTPKTTTVLQLVLVIPSGKTFQHMGIMGDTICCASKELVIIYQVNPSTRQVIFHDHDKLADHLLPITSLDVWEPYGYFVTTSEDCTIRIWSKTNLYKEVIFPEPTKCVVSGNDLLLNIDNRIDVIKEMILPDYLPLTLAPTEFIKYNDKIVPQEPPARQPLPKFDRNNIHQIFYHRNQNKEKDMLETVVEPKPSTPKPATPVKKRDILSPKSIHPRSTVNSPKETVQVPLELPPLVIITDQIQEPVKEEVVFHPKGLLIAPDGSVPNTCIQVEVDKWLQSHHRTPLQPILVKTKPKKVVAVIEEKKPKASFKDKFKKLIQEREKKLDEEEKEEKLKEEEERQEEVKPPPVEKKKLRVGAVAKLIHTSELQVTLSPLIEKMMTYQWFPTTAVFNVAPDGYKQIKIDPTPKKILSIVSQVYETQPEDRESILDYLYWLNEKEPFNFNLFYDQFARSIPCPNSLATKLFEHLKHHADYLALTICQYNHTRGDQWLSNLKDCGISSLDWVEATRYMNTQEIQIFIQDLIFKYRQDTSDKPKKEVKKDKKNDKKEDAEAASRLNLTYRVRALNTQSDGPYSGQVDALHYYVVKAQMEKEELERQRLAREEELRRLEAERLEKQRLLEAKQAKEQEIVVILEKPVKKEKPVVVLETPVQSSPKTKRHRKRKPIVAQSHPCHESREDMNIILNHFPPIIDHMRPPNNSMAMYLSTLNKAMPMEQVILNPFDRPSTQLPSKRFFMPHLSVAWDTMDEEQRHYFLERDHGYNFEED